MSNVAIEMYHPTTGVYHRQADPQVAGKSVRLDEETLSSEMTWRVLEEDTRLPNMCSDKHTHTTPTHIHAHNIHTTIFH